MPERKGAEGSQSDLTAAHLRPQSSSDPKTRILNPSMEIPVPPCPKAHVLLPKWICVVSITALCCLQRHAFGRGSARTHRLRSPVHACVYLPVPSIVPSDIQPFGGVPIATLEDASSADHTSLAARLVEALLLIHRVLITEPTRIFCVPAC